MFWLIGIVLTLTWGAGAFGSNYPWAYTPLMMASAALGFLGLVFGRSRTRAMLPMSLGLLALAVAAQLVPLSWDQLAELSPAAASIIRQRSLEFSLGSTAAHPISIEPSQTWLGLAFLGSLGMLLLSHAHMLNRETAWRLAEAIVVVGSMLATVGIVQQATFSGRIYGFWELVQGGSPFGPFVNRNHFAGWMLMGIPVALGYFLALVSRGVVGGKPGFRNALLRFSGELANRAALTGFAILVMCLSLVMTFSRSGITALGVALLLVGTVMARRQFGAARRTFVVGYVIVLVITVVSWVGLDQIATRFAQVDLSNVNQRPAIWADTIRIAKDFWLTGTGLNTYGVSTLFYQTSVPGLHLREAHSDYLQLAAEGGLLLGIPILLTVLAFAWEVRRRLREDEGSIWWIRMGAVTGLIAIAVQSAVEFSLQMPGNAAMFAVVAGLAIHDGRRASQPSISKSSRVTPLCEQCGSIQMVRVQAGLADKMVSVFTAKKPFVCRRCGWRARRAWRDDDLMGLFDYGVGGAEPDPSLAVLDEAADDRIRRRPKPRSARLAQKAESRPREFDLELSDLASLESTPATGANRREPTTNHRLSSKKRLSRERVHRSQVVVTIVASAVTVLLLLVLSLTGSCRDTTSL